MFLDFSSHEAHQYIQGWGLRGTTGPQHQKCYVRISSIVDAHQNYLALLDINILFKRESVIKSKSLTLRSSWGCHTHTHTHIHVCMCVCVLLLDSKLKKTDLGEMVLHCNQDDDYVLRKYVCWTRSLWTSTAFLFNNFLRQFFSESWLQLKR